jgi:hypothetical protein
MINKIQIKLQLIEALTLQAYLTKRWDNVCSLRGAAPDQDFVLMEYLQNQFMKDVARIERASTRTPKNVRIPLSVARILWKNWQQEFISIPLQLVFCSIDKELSNLNLKPI